MTIRETESRERCVETELNRVTTYDQYVDVVSCWEAFLTFNYSKEYEQFFFDRFPKITVSDRDLTPDFTAFFYTRVWNDF